jgi:hypothetical protein
LSGRRRERVCFKADIQTIPERFIRNLTQGVGGGRPPSLSFCLCVTFRLSKWGRKMLKEVGVPKISPLGKAGGWQGSTWCPIHSWPVARRFTPSKNTSARLAMGRTMPPSNNYDRNAHGWRGRALGRPNGGNLGGDDRAGRRALPKSVLPGCPSQARQGEGCTGDLIWIYPSERTQVSRGSWGLFVRSNIVKRAPDTRSPANNLITGHW